MIVPRVHRFFAMISCSSQLKILTRNLEHFFTPGQLHPPYPAVAIHCLPTMGVKFVIMTSFPALLRQGCLISSLLGLSGRIEVHRYSKKML